MIYLLYIKIRHEYYYSGDMTDTQAGVIIHVF